ncbi:Eukaryotic translation initiation factor 4H [Massospora cicadina]|nr:Eukaryotic translation initiation factor 4H [Massospora cicadina]
MNERDPRPRSEEIPTRGPFTAYVGNLPFDVNEESDLEAFFTGCNVLSVRIPMNYETQRPKGYCYVEFKERESLIKGLGYHGKKEKAMMTKLLEAGDVKAAQPMRMRRLSLPIHLALGAVRDHLQSVETALLHSPPKALVVMGSKIAELLDLVKQILPQIGVPLVSYAVYIEY